MTFTNSLLENENVNINVSSTTEINYYWRGDGDGKSWTMLSNWILSPNAVNVPDYHQFLIMFILMGIRMSMILLH
ncbi:hypothetical protein [Faecalibacter sp. LW9]|uniref:hypothetical protein n=1 Tax=Faecalibacter sp. LW9 TaxID=3103144 RepID=UPI002AFEE596|nr:hypothetical protein [Faecalibacter sp. LW9]